VWLYVFGVPPLYPVWQLVTYEQVVVVAVLVQLAKLTVLARHALHVKHAEVELLFG
jgi:hypothetical protein